MDGSLPQVSPDDYTELNIWRETVPILTVYPPRDFMLPTEGSEDC